MRIFVPSPAAWMLLLAKPYLAWAFSTSVPGRSTTQLWQQPQDEWSVADDWEALSSENPVNSAPDSNDIFNQDIAGNAAQTILPDNDKENIEPMSEEEAWLNEIIEGIVDMPVSAIPLYDTGLDAISQRNKVQTQEQKQQEMERLMEDEISMLIRCNESPEDMLVRTGRAIAELTVEQKQDVSQLLVWKEDTSTKGHWKKTPFFHQAIAEIFSVHACPNTKDNSQDLIMDAKAVSKWMTRSIGDELGTYEEKINRKGAAMTSAAKTKSFKIAPHDSRVLKVLTQYSEYGTGYLTLENLEQVYMDALTRHPGDGGLLMGDVETLQLQNSDHIRQVWRDFENHGIVGPREQEWDEEKLKLEEKLGSIGQQTKALLENADNFVDECEIVEYGAYEPPPTSKQVQQGYDAKNHKYIKQSSHEKVVMADDGKTPLYINEGEFVFIDEESCIGCMQCVSAAPSSFLMLENGRARTFNQRRGADVKQGVAACPVSCMHFVSFDELKEMETVRDQGDGRSDHRHMGHRRGHTPLHVAGIDSDNNHRSSWYHYMKNKCCTSGKCPQRGCFDCPSYRQSGENPYFQKKAKEAQHIRAQQFVDAGDVNIWRKSADL